MEVVASLTKLETANKRETASIETVKGNQYDIVAIIDDADLVKSIVDSEINVYGSDDGIKWKFVCGITIGKGKGNKGDGLPKVGGRFLNKYIKVDVKTPISCGIEVRTWR
jgi:hypothetical protein